MTSELVTAWWLRLRQLPLWARDAALLLLVAFPTAMDSWWNEAGTRQADALTYGLVVVSLAALPLRRRWPLTVALICGGALSGLYMLGHHGELLNLPVMMALYTVSVQGDRRLTVAVGILASAWSGLLGFTSDDPIGARGGSPVLEMIWPWVPLALGEAVRVQRELRARTEIEREQEAQRRVEAERARMAREVHDVVAHTMAGVNVQMAAAVAAFDADPDQARHALGEARALTRSALQELQATVSLLRAGEREGDANSTAPVPRLSDLRQLLPAVEAAGMQVSVEDDLDKVELTAAVELAVYRIVQEALTNVVRHSGARTVAVSLKPSPEGLEVEVVDDGRGPHRPNGVAAAGGGYGLVGMRERAHAVGGQLEHGPLAAGGFRVRAVVPTGRVSP